MTAGNVTHVVIAVVLAVGSSIWIVGGARGLVTGQLTPRMVRMSRGRGSLTDTTAIAIWTLFWGIGFLALGVSALADRNALVLVAVAMIAFGSVIGLLRDRHAHRAATSSERVG